VVDQVGHIILGGCSMLDLPELLAPASSVNGRISRVYSFTMELKPDTESDVIAGGKSAVFSAGPFGFGMC
jgi:hypothetical protein